MTGVIENTNSKCLRLFFGLTLAFAIIVSSIGCSETAIPSANAVGNATTTPVSGGTPAEAVANSKPVSTGTTTTAVQESANQDPVSPAAGQDDGMLKKAGDLFEKAKSGTGATAKGAKDWVQDKLTGAATASGEAADDTMKWARETFKSLKDKGLTTANTTSEWLSQDWKNMQSWEYKTTSLVEGPEENDKRLNELGAQGWECFHVEGSRFYFKKPADSYLRHLPFNDFIKLVPLLQQAR